MVENKKGGRLSTDLCFGLSMTALAASLDLMAAPRFWTLTNVGFE